MERRAHVLRRLATALLVVMAVLCLLAHRFAQGNAAWGWVLAFAEAALVGGLADWFAVTALFRHPLGLPIPHTAIVPANRDRIAESMARFLRAHFLTPAVVARRLAAMNVAGAVGAWLADPQARADERLRKAAASLAADVLEALDGERQLGRLVRRALRRKLAELDLAPLLGQLLTAAMAEGRHGPIIEAVLHRAGVALEENEEWLRAAIHARANAILRWTGLDERLANGILDAAYRQLAESIVDPAHPLRLRIEQGLEDLARDLVHDPAMRDRVARAKAAVLANPALGRWLDAMWETARERLLGVTGDTGTPTDRPHRLAAFGATLATNAQLQKTVNRFLRRAVAGTASRHAGAIVTLVSETVKRWDARALSSRVEAAVGRDLQFIRLNGTLVGGAVGLVLHGIAKLL